MHAKIEEAAAWRGVSVSKFLVDAAAKEADQVIQRERLFGAACETPAHCPRCGCCWSLVPSSTVELGGCERMRQQISH